MSLVHSLSGVASERVQGVAVSLGGGPDMRRAGAVRRVFGELVNGFV